MAGSYGHVVTDDGNLGEPEFVNDMLENGGDVYEAVEEMYGMIWWLAGRLHILSEATQHAMTATQIVEAAERNYITGLRYAKEANG